jgi:TRAP-type transport system periplasmic protein
MNEMLTRRSIVMGTAASAVFTALPTIARAQSRTLRFGHIFPTTHPYHLGLERFSELVNAKTGGEVTVQVYPSGQIGGEIQLLEGMGLGVADGCTAAAGSLAQTHNVSRFYLLDMPYLFRDYQAVEDFAEGEIGEEFRANLPQETGIRILGYGGAGFSQILNSKRPIFVPEDLAGMKMRVWESAAAKLSLELMNMTPTPMPYAEVFTALQQGVVDGLVNSMTTFYQTKMFEVAKYLSVSDQMYVVMPIMIGETQFQSLTTEQQSALQEAAVEATRYWRAIYPRDDAEYRGRLQEEGLEVNDVDKAAFREFVQKQYGRYTEVAGSEVQPMIDKLRNFASE